MPGRVAPATIDKPRRAKKQSAFKRIRKNSPDIYIRGGTYQVGESRRLAPTRYTNSYNFANLLTTSAVPGKTALSLSVIAAGATPASLGAPW
jgi:hypothetical protein